ncbi:MAG: tetratricopeptide repeat protein [Acidobacteriota bacterium]|nr:tetratricopeptide repeat protein [Acidobacteriota bacterium]
MMVIRHFTVLDDALSSVRLNVLRTFLRLCFWQVVFGMSFAYPQAQVPRPQQSSDFLAARQAFSEGRYLQAAGLFDDIADKTQTYDLRERAVALRMKANCFVKLSRFIEADAALRSSLRLEPRSTETLYLLGFVLQREDQPATSLGIFTQAAAIAPPQSDDLKMVALDYILLDDYRDGIHWLERALSLNANNAEGWYDLGRAHMHQGQFDEAIHAFQRSLSIDPRNAKALDNMGLSLEAQNKPEEALENYRAAVETAQASPQPASGPFLDLGTFLEEHARYGEAERVLVRATELAPNKSRCFEELARAYIGQAKDTQARTTLEHAVALDPKNPRLHYQLARLYRKLGLTQQSQNEFKETSRLYEAHSVSIEP